MVTLNRAVAVAMADGPAAGLAVLAQAEDQLGDHHRLHAVRAHLRELAGDHSAAMAGYRAAAARTTNLREQQYLLAQAARLTAQ
jgi:predicted RNA polymerase sigma factor